MVTPELAERVTLLGLPWLEGDPCDSTAALELLDAMHRLAIVSIEANHIEPPGRGYIVGWPCGLAVPRNLASGESLLSALLAALAATPLKNLRTLVARRRAIDSRRP